MVGVASVRLEEGVGKTSVESNIGLLDAIDIEDYQELILLAYLFLTTVLTTVFVIFLITRKNHKKHQNYFKGL